MKTLLLILSFATTGICFADEEKLDPSAEERKFGVRSKVMQGAWTVRSGTLSEKGAASMGIAEYEGKEFCYATLQSDNGWTMGIRRTAPIDGSQPYTVWYLQGPGDWRADLQTHGKVHQEGAKAATPITLPKRSDGTADLTGLSLKTAGKLSFLIQGQRINFDLKDCAAALASVNNLGKMPELKSEPTEQRPQPPPR